MAPSPGQPLSTLVSWSFVGNVGGLTARYGTYAGEHYKQVLPGGVVADQLYPPKKITQELYAFAERTARRLS